MMKKLFNRFLYWYYKTPLERMLIRFIVKGKATKVEAHELNIFFKQLGWTNKKAKRIFDVSIHLGIIQVCDHPIFKRRLCYRINPDYLK